MIEELTVAGLAMMGAYASRVAKDFSVTSHGANPWTAEAFQNCLAHASRMQQAIKMINGKINVAYRCPQVNSAVGGVPDSYHMRGLAVDIGPGAGFTPESASRTLYSASAAGKLGPVRTVIWEPGWAHIEWHDPRTSPPLPPPKFIKKVGDKYETVTV